MLTARIVYLGPNGGIPSGIGILTGDYKSARRAFNAAIEIILASPGNGHFFIEVFDNGLSSEEYEIVRDNEIWGFVP